MTYTASALNQFTATVHAADGEVFVASASSRVTLVEQVAHYVRERCDHVLWPSAAAEVRSLIDGGLFHAAIATYFANVGQRWDAEWLELGGLPFDDRADADEVRALGSAPEWHDGSSIGSRTAQRCELLGRRFNADETDLADQRR